LVLATLILTTFPKSSYFLKQLFETTFDYGGQPPANLRAVQLHGEKSCFYQLSLLFPILKHRVCHHINVFGGRGATALPLKLSNCQIRKLFLLSTCLQNPPKLFTIHYSLFTNVDMEFYVQNVQKGLRWGERKCIMGEI
jgi:hypothetical protein